MILLMERPLALSGVLKDSLQLFGVEPTRCAHATIAFPDLSADMHPVVLVLVVQHARFAAPA
jgi:hypothetical protein